MTGFHGDTHCLLSTAGEVNSPGCREFGHDDLGYSLDNTVLAPIQSNDQTTLWCSPYGCSQLYNFASPKLLSFIISLVGVTVLNTECSLCKCSSSPDVPEQCEEIGRWHHPLICCISMQTTVGQGWQGCCCWYKRWPGTSWSRMLKSQVGNHHQSSTVIFFGTSMIALWDCAQG